VAAGSFSVLYGERPTHVSEALQSFTTLVEAQAHAQALARVGLHPWVEVDEQVSEEERWPLLAWENGRPISLGGEPPLLAPAATPRARLSALAQRAA